MLCGSLREYYNSISEFKITMQEAKAEMKELRHRAEESNERIINSVGKVHARLDEHVRDHLTKGQ